MRDPTTLGEERRAVGQLTQLLDARKPDGSPDLDTQRAAAAALLTAAMPLIVSPHPVMAVRVNRET